MKVYTKAGDDGSTGLFYGGRVAKNDAAPVAYGAVDEAQAAIGVARALAEPGSELDVLLIALMRDLWVLMAELATAPENHSKLVDGTSRVTAEMVVELENRIDDTSTRFDAPTEFVVPGQNRLAAALDVARTTVRRAERESQPALEPLTSQVGPYLNRLSDLLWTLARWQEGEALTARQ